MEKWTRISRLGKVCKKVAQEGIGVTELVTERRKKENDEMVWEVPQDDGGPVTEQNCELDAKWNEREKIKMCEARP